jgi:hypothetical protein
MEEFIMMTVKEDVRRQYKLHMENFEFFAKCAKQAFREGDEKHYNFYVKKADEALFKIELLRIIWSNYIEVA